MGSISSGTILLIIVLYFLLLIAISWITSKNADNKTFFTANKNSPWPLVAFGMIGATLSGVTFISIPGVVGKGGYNMDFSYMQMVFGYLVGYFFIAIVLMPIYYRLNLTTIYGYLGKRFGFWSHKTASGYFLLSRAIGASLRLYLVAIVLQKFVMDSMDIPFELTVVITIILIWIYTFKGGIKTIVVTDTLQTTCMLLAVVLTIWFIGDALDLGGINGIISTVQNSDYSQMWFFEGGWNDGNNFFKQFISGALIAIVMTGLDQDMMQKNLTCKSLSAAQKNMASFSIVLIFANILFLTLGALLYIYASSQNLNLPGTSDQLYPTIALENLPAVVGVFFILGLIAAAYSSADSALTSLTTAFCIDFLNFEEGHKSEEDQKKTRLLVHVGFSVILLAIILLTKYFIKDTAVINGLFIAAGYTYGPILGLFVYGIFTNRVIKDKYVLVICLIAPLLTYLINSNADRWLNGFSFGSTLIALNAFITIIGLLLITKKNKAYNGG